MTIHLNYPPSEGGGFSCRKFIKKRWVLKLNAFFTLDYVFSNKKDKSNLNIFVKTSSDQVCN